MIIDSPCFKCKHLTPKEDGIFFCKAFPNPIQLTPEEIQEKRSMGNTIIYKGIPDQFVFNGEYHLEPIAGQVGNFVFEEGEPTEEQPQETMKKRHKVVNIKK